jgi:hypothetical protein
LIALTSCTALTGDDALANELALIFPERREHAEHHPAGWGRGVQRLLMGVEIDAERLDLVHEADEMLDGPTKPVDGPDQHNIELAAGSSADQLIERRALVTTFRATDCLVGELCYHVPAISSSDLSQLSDLIVDSLR